MHIRIAELLDYLDAQRRLLRAAVDRVPADRRAHRPAPDRWSVAEVLEHLSIVERVLATTLATRVAEARAEGVGAETATTPVLGTIDMRRVLDRSRAIVAGERVRPRDGLDAVAAWTALEQARTAMRDAIRDADGLALGAVTHPHPVLGPLTLYEWIAFVGAHEARHTAQVDEVAAALAQSAAASAPASAASA